MKTIRTAVLILQLPLMSAGLLACSSDDNTTTDSGTSSDMRIVTSDTGVNADGRSNTDGGGTGNKDGATNTSDAAGSDSTAAASSAKVVAFAYANDKATASYTPQATRSYNAGGGAITAKRTSAGVYEIEFGGLTANSGSVIVTAYNFDGVCNVTKWLGATVNVNCYNNSGVPTDAAYLVRVMLTGVATTANTVAYAWADNATSASYTPDTGSSYNASQGAITTTRSAAGTYAVQFAGANFNAGANVQVTTYNSNRHCSVPSFAGNTINVKCYDAAGVAGDSRFLINVVQTGAGTAEIVAHAFANNRSEASYAPNPTYVYNKAQKGATATRAAAGRYQITFAELSHTTGNVLVSAYGSDKTCAVQTWTGATVKVDCRDRSGGFADTQYVIAVTK